MKSISLYTPSGQYLHGTLGSDGRLSLHGPNGSYFHGTARLDGSYGVHGPEGAYFAGRLREEDQEFLRECERKQRHAAAQ